MGLGGKENLNTYFYKLYIDKLFDEAIMSERNDEEISDTIYDLRSDILNNLIVKYLSSKLYLIDDIEFNIRFFKACSINQLYLSDKEEIVNFFKYRNEDTKFTESTSYEQITRNKKLKSVRLYDEVLGKIQFIEDK